MEVTSLLVKHGADVIAWDKSGLTPLHEALGSGSMEVARLLIEHGTDTTTLNEEGWTPLLRLTTL